MKLLQYINICAAWDGPSHSLSFAIEFHIFVQETFLDTSTSISISRIGLQSRVLGQDLWVLHTVHPGKLTWSLKHHQFETGKSPSKPSFLRFHVYFHWCIPFIAPMFFFVFPQGNILFFLPFSNVGSPSRS